MSVLFQRVLLDIVAITVFGNRLESVRMITGPPGVYTTRSGGMSSFGGNHIHESTYRSGQMCFGAACIFSYMFGWASHLYMCHCRSGAYPEDSYMWRDIVLVVSIPDRPYTAPAEIANFWAADSSFMPMPWCRAVFRTRTPSIQASFSRMVTLHMP